MDAVLNYQNPTIGGPDLMVIDGDFQQFTKTDEQVEAFSKLNSYNANQLEIPFYYGKSSATENFYLYKDKKNGVILFSTFENKDQKGRNVGYIYYFNNADNVYQARTTLENYALIAHVRPNKKDLDMFEKMLQLHSKHPTLANLSGKLTIAFRSCLNLIKKLKFKYYLIVLAIFAIFSIAFWVGSSDKENSDEQNQTKQTEIKNR